MCDDNDNHHHGVVMVVETRPIIESIQMCLPPKQNVNTYSIRSCRYIHNETPVWPGVMVRLLYRPAH